MQFSGKLSEGLMRSLASIRSESAAIPIIVRYTSAVRVMRQVDPTPGLVQSYRFRLLPYAHMHATPDAIRTLVRNADITRIYQDLPVYAVLDSSVPHIGAPRLWNVGLTGEGVRLAIVDTGVDSEHPDLVGRVVEAMDFTGEGLADRNGHGTHCAGIAVGSGAASGGLYRGVAPDALVCSAKVLRSDGQGMMSDVMAGIEWAVDQGVQIINLSLGSPGPANGTDALSEMCEAAVELGVIVCVAAGNEGPSPSSIGAPGAAPHVITVGAASDHDIVAGFSSRGPTLDGRIKPDVVLPGVDVIAPRASGTAMGTVLDDAYTCASGTSMAAPHAAGVCALLLQSFPSLTPEQAKARLQSTAVDCNVEPNAQGKGRVDAWGAYNGSIGDLPAPPTPWPDPNPPEDSPGAEPEPPEQVPTPSPAPSGCLLGVLQILLHAVRGLF